MTVPAPAHDPMPLVFAAACAEFDHVAGQAAHLAGRSDPYLAVVCARYELAGVHALAARLLDGAWRAALEGRYEQARRAVLALVGVRP